MCVRARARACVCVCVSLCFVWGRICWGFFYLFCFVSVSVCLVGRLVFDPLFLFLLLLFFVCLVGWFSFVCYNKHGPGRLEGGGGS